LFPGGKTFRGCGSDILLRKFTFKLRHSAFVLALSILMFLSLEAPGYASQNYDTTVLTVTSEQGETVTSVTAKIADRPLLRYLGLSGTDRLDTGTGMWFVYSAPDTRAFVMREMNYPIDIVFVDETRRITRIHSAPLADTTPLTRYRGWGQWVLEVPYGWASRRDVRPGYKILNRTK